MGYDTVKWLNVQARQKCAGRINFATAIVLDSFRPISERAVSAVNESGNISVGSQ